MITLRALSADAWRRSAFKNIASAERELATAETFVRLNDWSGAAIKLEQAAVSYHAAAKALREMDAITQEVAS